MIGSKVNTVLLTSAFRWGDEQSAYCARHVARILFVGLEGDIAWSVPSHAKRLETTNSGKKLTFHNQTGISLTSLPKFLPSYVRWKQTHL
jgi:hypothetical protein